MSKTPVSTGCFSICSISFARRCASGTPRRLIPTRPTFLLPSCFSTISCASRTSVRSISEADISRPFSRNLGFRTSVVSLIAIPLDDIRTPAPKRKPAYQKTFPPNMPGPPVSVGSGRRDRLDIRPRATTPYPSRKQRFADAERLSLLPEEEPWRRNLPGVSIGDPQALLPRSPVETTAPAQPRTRCEYLRYPAGKKWRKEPFGRCRRKVLQAASPARAK